MGFVAHCAVQLLLAEHSIGRSKWGSENLFGSLVGLLFPRLFNGSSSRPARVSGSGENIDAVPRASVTNG